MPRIAYFGPQGTFTEQATRALAAPGDELLPLDTIALVVRALRAGEVDAACVPVENSVEGAVPATMDALAADEPVVAVAETVLPIVFTILTRGDGPIRTVASHPHALAQVSGWLTEHLPEARMVAASSTAAAAVGVQRGDFDAAVTAPVAVEHYPLTVLATGVADVPDAQTRFLLLRRPGALPEPTGHDRTSVIAFTPDRTGALAELLTELAIRGLSLTRLEARPTRGRLGEYRFYLDFAGHVAEQRVGDALAALHRRCTSVRFLGSFPIFRPADTAPVDPGPAPDTEFVAAAEWVAALREGTRA